MPRTKQGKTRDVNQPYEVYVCDLLGWEWRVLKKYQHEDAENDNQWARWYCAVKSPYTGNSYYLGDTYITDIRQAPRVALAYRENPSKPEDNWTADWYKPEVW